MISKCLSTSIKPLITILLWNPVIYTGQLSIDLNSVIVRKLFDWFEKLQNHFFGLY